jgi:hypothetical protein
MGSAGTTGRCLSSPTKLALTPNPGKIRRITWRAGIRSIMLHVIELGAANDTYRSTLSAHRKPFIWS